MRIHRRHLNYCMDRANQISDHYRQFVLADTSDKSIDDLRYTCCSYLNTTIEWYSVPIDPASNVYGACIQSPGRAVILYANHLNRCWTRFVLCKEMFHAVLNENEYANVSVEQHVTDFTSAAVAVAVQRPPAPPVIAEKLAELAALEFMFPFRMRLQVRSKKPRTPQDFRSIAEIYLIPQVHVEQCLSDSYMNVLQKYCRCN